MKPRFIKREWNLSAESREPTLHREAHEQSHNSLKHQAFCDCFIPFSLWSVVLTSGTHHILQNSVMVQFNSSCKKKIIIIIKKPPTSWMCFSSCCVKPWAESQRSPFQTDGEVCVRRPSYSLIFLKVQVYPSYFRINALIADALQCENLRPGRSKWRAWGYQVLLSLAV